MFALRIPPIAPSARSLLNEIKKMAKKRMVLGIALRSLGLFIHMLSESAVRGKQNTYMWCQGKG